MKVQWLHHRMTDTFCDHIFRNSKLKIYYCHLTDKIRVFKENSICTFAMQIGQFETAIRFGPIKGLSQPVDVTL